MHLNVNNKKLFIVCYNAMGASINDGGNWEGGGVTNWSKLPTDVTKKTADMEEGGVKNSEKLSTSFMDGPIPVFDRIHHTTTQRHSN